MTQIIAAVDSSPLAQTVRNSAVWAAQVLKQPLLFLHALEKHTTAENANLSGTIGVDAREQLKNKFVDIESQRAKLAYEQGKTLLDNACAHAKSHGITNVRGEQRHGELIETLQHYADQSTLIVLGRSGEDHHQDSKLIGAHLEHAVRSLNSPLLVTVEPFQAPSTFMIAYDGRDTANRLINFIANNTLLKTLNAHLIYIGEHTDKAQHKLNHATQTLSNAGYSVKPQIIAKQDNSISDTLEHYRQQNNIDLIAMGAFAKKGFRRLFVGTNTLTIIAKSDVPVLIMK